MPGGRRLKASLAQGENWRTVAVRRHRERGTDRICGGAAEAAVRRRIGGGAAMPRWLLGFCIFLEATSKQ
jgi:hypothetical protein